MRFAVISDIHSNLYALKKVYEDIERRGIERVYCTGDLVGYLTDPNGVIDFLREKKCRLIKGNHDEKYIGGTKLSEEEITEELRNKGGSFLYTNQKLSDENRYFLEKLPSEIILDDMHFVHGSPDNSSEYMYAGDDVIKRVANKTSFKYIFYGHTHLPNYEIVGRVHFINPGSVGKPKHGNPNASYVEVIKEEAFELYFHQVAYDLDGIILDIKSEPLINDKLVNDLKQEAE
ncbi:metallophosphoesterase family protein [Acidaminobacter sp. JC074]|uniref:metallophosphoesterase family protein n=1 Tax=Acidaminobacter sp. JC074 TaxID=2530199 RepID=UPI001F0E2074|nr:metallophosphoesterase family protein [Acidaminobacter sp. JC074]MCH4887566.1 metallophosphoesterase family protein [Acidaminobacter sp. JC074]